MELVEKTNRSRWRKAITKSRFRKMPNSLSLMHGDTNDSVDDDNSSNNGEQNQSSGGLSPRSYSILNGRYGTYLFNKYNHNHKNNTNANADYGEDVILLPNVGLDSLVDFEPRPLRSFFSNKQPLLRILIINDKKYHLSKNKSASSRNDFSNSKTSMNDVNQFNLNSNANSSSSMKTNSKNTTSEIIDVSMSDLLDNLNKYADELTTEERMRQSRSRSTSTGALANAAAVLTDTIYNSNNKHIYNNSSINNSNRIFHLNASSNNNNNNQNTRSFNPRFPEVVSVGNTNTSNSRVQNSPLRTIAENGGGSNTNSTLSSTSSKILASTSQKLPQSQHELSTTSSTSVGGVTGGKHNIHIDNYDTNSYSNNYNNNMSQNNNSSSNNNNNNNNNNFEKIQELRGRDLCCVSRHINEVDIPVVLLRQHVCIFSIRYDVKAIVQAHRILFIGETSQDDFSGLKRHMNVFLDDDDSSSASPSNQQQHSLSPSSWLHESEHEHRDIFRSTGGGDNSNGNIRSSSNRSSGGGVFHSTGGDNNNNNSNIRSSSNRTGGGDVFHSTGGNDNNSDVINNNHNNSSSHITGDNNVGNRNDESNTTDNSHTANNTNITDSVTNLTSTANNEKYTLFNSTSNTRYQSSGKDSIRMKSPRSVTISSTSFSPSFSTSTSTSSTASSPLTKSRSMSQMPLQPPNIGTRSGTVSFDHSNNNDNNNSTNSSNHSGNSNNISSNRNSWDNRNNSHNNSSNNINGFNSNNSYNDNDVLSKLDHFPFEVRAVEGLLSTVIGIHSNEYDNLCIESDPYFCALLPSSSSSASANKRPQASLLTLEQQETLRRIKEEISDVLTRIRFTTSMIRSLLENDEMLPFLCLKAFEKDPGLYQHYNNAPNKAEARRLLQTAVPASEINDIEFLLEYHLTECQQLEYEVSSTLKRLENAEQSILVRLNMSQNQLLIANTIVTVLAGSVAFGSFIAGLFGMNLDNDKYQSINGSFLAVTLLTVASVALIAVATIYYFQYTSMLPAQVVLENPMNRRLSSMNSNPASSCSNSRRNTIDNSSNYNLSNLNNNNYQNNSNNNMDFGNSNNNSMSESSYINDSNKRFQYKYSTIPENLIT